MTSIPLSLVVGFLRPRDALHVLGGAPYTSADVCGIAGLMVDAIDWELEQRPDAVLYLGDGEVCPAAEGWTSRVLAMARDLALTAPMIEDDGRITLWSGGREEYDYRWGWSEGETEPFEGGDFTLLPGTAPSTPAKRLAAVLVYELGRAR